MEFAETGQGFIEDQAQHGLGLIDFTKGLALAVQILQGRGQEAMHGPPCRFDPFRGTIQHFEEVVDVPQNRGSVAPEEKLRYPRISCPVLPASVPWPIGSMQKSPPHDSKHRKSGSLCGNCRKRRQNMLEPHLLWGKMIRWNGWFCSIGRRLALVA